MYGLCSNFLCVSVKPGNQPVVYVRYKGAFDECCKGSRDVAYVANVSFCLKTAVQLVNLVMFPLTTIIATIFYQ